MIEFKIQCEHAAGNSFAWFTIALWRSQVHSTRQLISLCERYLRIKDILIELPPQEKASGSAVGMVPKASGIGERIRHSAYAGVTGIRLLANQECIAQWCKRVNAPETPTPDLATMSTRQIAQRSVTNDPADLIIESLMQPEYVSEPAAPPSAPLPAVVSKRRRIIQDAPLPSEWQQKKAARDKQRREAAEAKKAGTNGT